MKTKKRIPKEPIKAEVITEPKEINPKTGKEKGKAPEIIYTTQDIYNYNIENNKPKKHIRSYTQEQKDSITNNIISFITNGQSTSKAVTNAGIDIDTFYRWCDKDSFLYGRYVRACERLGVALFDRILDEVDSMATVEDSIIASKKIDALKWLSGKLNQRFSDRSDVYIQTTNNTLNVATNELSASDRDKLMKSILSKLNSKIEGLDNAKNLLNE